MTLLTAALLAAIVLLAYTAQAVTGFGSTVLSLTLAALLLPIPFLMPVVVSLNVPFCGYLVWKDRHRIDWPLLRREVLPLMVVGASAGAASAGLLAGHELRRPLGALVLVLAALDLWRLSQRREKAPGPLLKRALILGSGFTQGLYASGGPLLAAALAGSGRHRSAVRASLSVVWLVINIGLTTLFLLGGRFNAEVTRATLALFPVTVLGLWLGNHLHHRIDERQFRLLLDLLLLASGTALLT